ncbi:MAG: thermonuclease family protein [Halobacteria archaeon]|nr:thermonuclease family protein [Halobacteria archaeon]
MTESLVAVLVALVLLAGFSGCLSQDTSQRVNVTVTHVTDGDTLDVLYPDGSGDEVRLVGVDAPEVHAESDPSEFEGVSNVSCLRRWGDKASEYLSSIVSNRSVEISTDPAFDRRGYYGRLLAYVYYNGTLVNLRLVRKGYARVYDSDFSKKRLFLRAEKRARRERLGLWGCAGEGPEDENTR